MQDKRLRETSAIFRTLRKFILLNIGIALAINIIGYPRLFLSFEGIWTIRKDLIFSFLVSMSLSYGGYVIDDYFEQRISWIKTPIKRLLLTAITYLSYSFIVSFVLVSGYVLLSVDEVNWQNISWIRMLKNTIMPTTAALIIISIFIARSWLYEWRNAALEAERLKSAILASQNQSLKEQLNPHFLFNSLNTLSGLVFESPEKSAEFIQQLAKIYRYVLDVQQEELVSLAQEIDFARNYLALQQIRFGKNLHVEINVDQSTNVFIPPLSLQLLLENAVKHNIISQDKPLHLSIKTEKDCLVVINKLQPKKSIPDENSGIGLDNIRKRYALLSDKEVKVIKAENEFRVELPLLEIV
jgi:sensor histidine kinase YesM